MRYQVDSLCGFIFKRKNNLSIVVLNYLNGRSWSAEPIKTQVMWLGSGQQLKHVDIDDIPVLPTTVPVVGSARDLEVIPDSRLTLTAHISQRSVGRIAPATTPARPIDDDGSCKNRSCSVYTLRLDYCNRCSTVCRTFYCTSCSLYCICRTPLHD